MSRPRIPAELDRRARTLAMSRHPDAVLDAADELDVPAAPDALPLAVYLELLLDELAELEHRQHNAGRFVSGPSSSRARPPDRERPPRRST